MREAKQQNDRYSCYLSTLVTRLLVNIETLAWLPQVRAAAIVLYISFANKVLFERVKNYLKSTLLFDKYSRCCKYSERESNARQDEMRQLQRLFFAVLLLVLLFHVNHRHELVHGGLRQASLLDVIDNVTEKKTVARMSIGLVARLPYLNSSNLPSCFLNIMPIGIN